ncbi:hypothetical protein EDC14_102765 [Hydrogenispora ethanolica]|uniref:LPS-assembly protein n=1 Tax=Hydrogenispora ethanolica TaxID=1082276 RepID=A0A4R1R945_HYDET|nr:LPS-assembly protein LptD [Hydrogenispora ethanolica]TCL62214.1 hypothetical protein EDC14_102765 [Hydrogenispora ethanolica]
MRRAFWVLGMLVVFILGHSGPARGALDRVLLSADEVHYNYETKQIRALGAVVIHYKEIQVTADWAIIDQELNFLLATGEVCVEKNGDQFQGQRFLYSIKEQQGWLSPAHTTITGSEIEKAVRYSAEEALVKEEEILAKGSFFTGCDLEKPHYHFTAKELEYYPDKRIILRRVWYWEHGRRLIFLPYFYISLEDKEDNFEFEVGHNEVDGWYALVGYKYFMNEKNRLQFESKFTELNGDLYSVKHRSILSSHREWFQEYYLADKSGLGYPQPEYGVALGYKDETDPKRAMESNLTHWQRSTWTGNSYPDYLFTLAYRGMTPYPYLNLQYQDTGEDPLRTMNFHGSWNYNLDPTASLRFWGSWSFLEYLRNKSLASNNYNNFVYDLNYLKNWDGSNLNLKYKETAVFDGNTYAENVKPDITYTVPSWRIPYLDEISISGNYTRLERFQKDVVTGEGERFGLDMSKRWTLGVQWIPNLTLANNLYLRKYRVNNVTSDVADLNSALTATKYFKNNLSASLGVGYSMLDGEVNALFNSKDSGLQPGGFANNLWALNNEHLFASLNNEYYFQTQIGRSTLTSKWMPASSQSIGLSTQYDWTQGPGLTNLEARYNLNEEMKLALLLGYDFQYEAWNMKQFEMLIDRKLTTNWKVEAALQYSMVQEDFSIGNVTFTYDWHCRQLLFHYDWTDQSFWFRVIFKAFPQASLQFDKDMELLNDPNFLSQ